MPYYEYRCERCVVTFELFMKSMVSSSEAPAPSCPQCASADTRRVVTQVAVLKGANPGLGASAYPTSWSSIDHGNLETTNYWRTRVEKEKSEEAKDSGLASERLLHAEQRYQEVAQRTSPRTGDTARTNDHDHAGSSGRGHAHSHEHGDSHGASHGVDNSSHPAEKT